MPDGRELAESCRKDAESRNLSSGIGEGSKGYIDITRIGHCDFKSCR